MCVQVSSLREEVSRKDAALDYAQQEVTKLQEGVEDKKKQLKEQLTQRGLRLEKVDIALSPVYMSAQIIKVRFSFTRRQPARIHQNTALSPSVCVYVCVCICVCVCGE